MTAGDEAGPGGSRGERGPGKDAGTGADAPAVTIIVDGANVVGSRPDGWWRDRAGAAVRLHDELGGDPSGLVQVRVILVLEGAARAAEPRIAERARTAESGRVRAGDAGGVHVVSAPGSGDDEIVRLARSRAGRRIVVTADRELRRRSLAAGAQVAGPSWLYALL